MNNTKKYYFVACPICGCKRYGWDISIKDKFEEEIKITVCPNDGIIYLNPRWSKTQYIKFYKSIYDNLKRPDVQENNKPIFKNAKRVMKRILNNGFNQFNSVLDIGAGRGWMLEYIKMNKPGVETFASESSTDCKIQIENNGHNIIDLDLDLGSHKINGNKKFDLIIMRHVLEHLYQPNIALSIIKDLMHDNSVLYIAVPNVNRIKRIKGFHCAHLYYFSDINMRTLFNNIGFEVLVSGDELKSELWYILKKSDSIYKRQLDKIWRYING